MLMSMCNIQSSNNQEIMEALKLRYTTRVNHLTFKLTWKDQTSKSRARKTTISDNDLGKCLLHT